MSSRRRWSVSATDEPPVGNADNGFRSLHRQIPHPHPCADSPTVHAARMLGPGHGIPASIADFAENLWVLKARGIHIDGGKYPNVHFDEGRQKDWIATTASLRNDGGGDGRAPLRTGDHGIDILPDQPGGRGLGLLKPPGVQGIIEPPLKGERRVALTLPMPDDIKSSIARNGREEFPVYGDFGIGDNRSRRSPLSRRPGRTVRSWDTLGCYERIAAAIEILVHDEHRYARHHEKDRRHRARRSEIPISDRQVNLDWHRHCLSHERRMDADSSFIDVTQLIIAPEIIPDFISGSVMVLKVRPGDEPG